MSLFRSLRDRLSDESLRVAILIGLATVPITVVDSWESVTGEASALGGTVSGSALLLAGVVVGYYYHGRETSARRAGIWTGLAGSLATIIIFGANSATTIAGTSWPWIVVTLVGSLVTLAIGVGLAVFITALVAIGTDWVLTRLEREHRVVDPESGATAERGEGALGWWLSIVGYAILAPITFGSLLWFEPASDGAALVALLLLFPTVLLSVAAVIGLFVGVTAPRDARTEWFPRVWLYVGGPIGVGVLVYLFAAARGWGYPPGYAQYAFLAALWVAIVVYLVNKRRYQSNGFQRTTASS
ncbi:hypothetical protein G6M89_06655 [Natronolimnobius sp. AArcel1]|uniref:DUF5518 domain-containing protein n=1 Tax=Natronolimnobius sp. AArcel1 TaxID=1679093 RepID=UPI0013ED610B|nr:DUF5518 domain-containing protein [Natronolimnobius sp. AArcel1]NGM68691.1 hypothetical protein [Natronolimnobius sp. AArcel1]